MSVPASAARMMRKSGFTLIELLIAVAISAFIMSGIYVMFNSVINTKSHLETASDELYLFQSLQRLIARDIRMMSSGAASFPPEASGEKRLFTLVTQNSLTFNKAISVDVAYVIEDSTLYREERLNHMNYVMRIPLVHGVEAWAIEYFDGSQYREGFRNGSYIFRFTFTVNGRQMGFVTGRLVESSFE